MAHTYMHFDFGADEGKAQEARHKLDVWKQAFRLDKKLQYKLERPENLDDDEVGAGDDDTSATSKDSQMPTPKSKSRSHKEPKATDNDAASEQNGGGNVSLLVRLYFSSHEKLSEQRWLERIPTEEPFKGASPRILRQGEAGFDEALKQFADLD
jgi:hypothetical protein